MKKKLINLLRKAIEKCSQEGLLKEVPLPDFVVEIPNNPEHGHYATNLPMALASSQKKNPREIASIIVGQLNDDEGLIEKVEVAGPGFINFTIASTKWQDFLSSLLKANDTFGRSDTGKGEKVLLEFVSANPTGPLHLGHGRGAALGDTLARVLRHCGYGVATEFYINDAGQQVRLLGESIYSRWMQMKDPHYPFPENGYRGEYVLELAKDISREHDLRTMSKEEAVELCSSLGRQKMLEEIRQNLSRFRVEFDVWYSEKELVSSGKLQKTLDVLRSEGHIYEHEGALWIKTTAFGDDKDRVIRKQDGSYTYFATDIAYHLDKWDRGFTKAINIWGADHHGYIPRMKAALEAHGIHRDWLSVLLIQLVKLYQGGKEVKMSKRAGRYVTLKKLVEEVGVDAVRFVFLTKNHDSPLDVDIDLVKAQDSNNPVYYVQYAHARACSILRKASEEGITIPMEPGNSVRLLNLKEEIDLIRTMAEFPWLLEDICRTLEPHRLTYYLGELAATFHRYFNLGTKNPEHRVVQEDVELSRARLLLTTGVKQVLYLGLRLLGVEAPQQM